MLEIVLTSCESDQYLSAPKGISKFPLMYMTDYFCRSVYISFLPYAFSNWRFTDLGLDFALVTCWKCVMGA